MSITIATSYVPPVFSEQLSGAIIQDVTVLREIQQTHLAFARLGAQVQLSDGGIFQTTNTSYTTVNAAGEPLDAFTGVLRLRRDLAQSGTLRRGLSIRAWGRQAVLEVKIFAPDTKTTLATLQLGLPGSAGGGDWRTLDVDFTLPQTSQGGVLSGEPRTLALSLRGRATIGTALILSPLVYERRAVASDIPL